MLIYATQAAADAAKARAAAAGLGPGYGSLRKGNAQYIIFRGSDTEKAKQYLLDNHKVTKKLFYYVVETPNGNWGMDIDGLYLETLLPWQLDTHGGRVLGRNWYPREHDWDPRGRPWAGRQLCRYGPVRELLP